MDDFNESDIFMKEILTMPKGRKGYIDYQIKNGASIEDINDELKYFKLPLIMD